MEKRIGRQTPTLAHILPYEETKGEMAALLYAQSGRELMEWQKLLLADIMAVNEDGLWIHMKFGWEIPRRNGKSELLIARSIFGLVNHEQVLYSAHKTTTSSSAYIKIIRMLDKMGFRKNEDYRTTAGHGLEHIEWLKPQKGEVGGVINFRTRTGTGGLGEGYDLLIIDEAQEYTTDQETALMYVVTDSKNPQTLFCGTPPTAVSKGTVFPEYRDSVISGKTEDEGWAEWSVPELSNTHNTDLWYETNPSLGLILSERNVRSEIKGDPYSLDVNIQRLGLWVRYNLKSAISKTEWEAQQVDSVKLPENHKIFMGIKYGKDGANVSAAVAVQLENGDVFVECLDCRSQRDNSAWLIAYMKNPNVKEIVIDGAGGRDVLTDEMQNANIDIPPILPKVGEIIAANALFEKRFFSGQIKHTGQPALTQVATNCEHRAIGSNGGFGYQSILEGADISLLDAVVLAHWACLTFGEDEPQGVYI